MKNREHTPKEEPLEEILRQIHDVRTIGKRLL